MIVTTSDKQIMSDNVAAVRELAERMRKQGREEYAERLDKLAARWAAEDRDAVHWTGPVSR